MLKKRFLLPIFLLSFSWQPAAAENTTLAGKTAYDLGTVEVVAPAWHHPETITGKPADELYFETLAATGRTTLSDALDGQMGLFCAAAAAPVPWPE